MKYLIQFFVILCFSMAGELLHFLIPLPIPASIYGLVLLFFALVTGRLKLSQVKETADFLIGIMPIMFVPAGVGLIEKWASLQEMLLPILVILVGPTIAVMAVAGRVTQWGIRRKEKH